MICEVLAIGRTDYDSALSLQIELLEKKLDGEEKDYLILVEHDPVVTIGLKSDDGDVTAGPEALNNRGITLRETTRGGAATYHEPGQLVGYPIIDLNRQGRDVHNYLRRLEECVIAALATFELESIRLEGKTGVWVEDRKIASIGIAVRRWITYHGFAVNVENEMAGFDTIVPCGMPECRMTSVSSELGRRVTTDEFAKAILPVFAEEFQLQLAADSQSVTL